METWKTGQTVTLTRPATLRLVDDRDGNYTKVRFKKGSEFEYRGTADIKMSYGQKQHFIILRQGDDLYFQRAFAIIGKLR